MSPIELTQKLTQHEDADTAIAVYKEANFIIGQYEEVKKAALNLAENELRLSGEAERKTIAGSCGWTKPKAKKLNEIKWRDAIKDDRELQRLEYQFNQLKSDLEEAQLPYMELAESRFFIR